MNKELTLLTDLYQLTMMQGYFEQKRNEIVTFDMFYRKNPFGNGYAIAAGLHEVMEYIKNIEFTEESIEYLRTLQLFTEDFLAYLKTFKFTGTIYAVQEGSVVFPNEPLFRVEAPIIEAQFIETTLLNIVNHQSLIATKASRVCLAAGDDTVLEFGLRRAQGPDAGLYGAKAAVIGGCHATSNVLAGQKFGVSISGTHAHSWVMSFETELEAFRTYASIFPHNCILLVDTYDTLKSGVPNAIKVFKEMRDKGIESKKIGIRLDSGDLAYLSKEARKMLDEAGFENAIISASNDLDEYLITDLKSQGAKITLWGVGTSMITAKDCPSFGGVYKLAAIKKGDVYEPKIKISENIIKITNPSCKKILRLIDNESGKMIADLIALNHEVYDTANDLTIFDEKATWRTRTLKGGTYSIKEMLVPVIVDGKMIYKEESIDVCRSRCKEQLELLWEENKRLINPQPVIVDISKPLYDLKMELMNKAKNH